MTTSALNQIFQMIDALSPDEKQQVVDHIMESTQTEPQADLVWTEEELAEILAPAEPMTGKQIVEAGLTGGWKDMGIKDSVEWLAQQRARRRNKYRW